MDPSIPRNQPRNFSIIPKVPKILKKIWKNLKMLVSCSGEMVDPHSGPSKHDKFKKTSQKSRNWHCTSSIISKITEIHLKMQWKCKSYRDLAEDLHFHHSKSPSTEPIFMNFFLSKAAVITSHLLFQSHILSDYAHRYSQKCLENLQDSTFSTISPEVFNGFRSYSHPISQSGLPFRKKKVYQNRFPFDRVIAILRFSPFRLYLGNDSTDFAHLRT